MINKTFLSLVSALLISAMLVLLFDVTKQIQNQTDAFNPHQSQRITKSSMSDYLSLENYTITHSSKNPNRFIYDQIKLEDNSSKSNQIINTAKSARRFDQAVPGNSYSLSIAGHVVDSNNLPLMGVVVKQSGHSAGFETNESGHFQLDLDETKNHYLSLIFRRSGYKEKILHLEKSDLQSKPAVMLKTTMEYADDTVTVDGWIGESNGVNIEGEVIKLSSLSDNLYYSTISDSQGSFSFEGIRLGVNYQVKIKPSKKYKSISLNSIRTTVNNTPIHITLEPLVLTSVRGLVVDTHGGSVAHLDFKIRSEFNSTYEFDVSTDEYGEFQLDEFPMGEFSFQTKSPEFFRVTGIQVSESSYKNLVIPIDVGTNGLSGWVLDQNGLPVVAARAVLDAEFDDYSAISSSIRTIITDDSGFFEFNNLGAGEHYITIYAKGFINEGISYNAGSRIDQLYFRLSKWNDSLISSETLKAQMNKVQ